MGRMVPGGMLATRLQRFLGAFIDGLIVGVSAQILGYIAGYVIGMVLGNGLGPVILAFVVGNVIQFGVFLAVNGYLLATSGQTVGKLVMKTRIVSLHGEKMPFNELILKRYLWIFAIQIIPCVGAIVVLVNALMIFRENHHCLWDDIAGTNVVEVQ